LVRASQSTQDRLKALKKLFLDDKLAVEQYRQGEKLLTTAADQLDDTDQKKRQVYIDLAEGKLSASYLLAALNSVETPEQRKARLAREALLRAAAQKQAKIAELFKKAKSNDSKDTGKAAIAALDELLKLDPDHAEGLKLRQKIADYFGPTKLGDTSTNSIGMKLTYIPAGSFMMGSPTREEGRDDDETQLKVTLTQPFLMGVTEVTQGQWEAVMGTSIEDQRQAANREGSLKGQGKDHPIYYVSWEEAVDFCAKLTERERRAGRLTKAQRYSLPTEAQWEYACRAGTSSEYASGSGLTALKSLGWASYAGKWGSAGGTKSVASFKANKWGLHDMHGNVSEWCADWYGDYPARATTDPTGVSKPSGNAYRVMRGGGWSSRPAYCRSAGRNWNVPDNRSSYGGFRVVLFPLKQD
jgi:formylglycine-generating enzyme required for sulfatase activity